MKPDDLKELLDTVSEKVRKETARDFAERVKERIRFLKTLFHATGEGEYDGIELNEIDELAKQYGVEVKE